MEEVTKTRRASKKKRESRPTGIKRVAVAILRRSERGDGVWVRRHITQSGEFIDERDYDIQLFQALESLLVTLEKSADAPF